MIVVDIPPTSVGTTACSMREAFDRVFDVEALRHVHGDDLIEVTPWRPRRRRGDGEKRTIVVAVPMDDLPQDLRGVVATLVSGQAKSILVQTKQTVDRSDPNATAWEVHNRVRIANLVGSDLLRAKPTFVLRRGDDGVVRLSGSVTHHATLPPPFHSTAERFMAQQTRVNLDKYIGYFDHFSLAPRMT